jgi:putative membrane protein
MHIFRAHKILYAAIVVIAASFSFSCEPNRYTEVPEEDYNIQPGQNQSSLKKENDAAFLTLAVNDVLLESQLAELAVRRAKSPEVKEFAISVMTDHSIAMDELREIGARIDVAPPEEMSPHHRRHFLRIAKKNGLEFDHAFCDFMHRNNSVALKKFEQIAQDGNSEFLRNWAWGKLGILKRHIAMAQSIESGSGDSAELSSLMK